jgi:hypothetical protein
VATFEGVDAGGPSTEADLVVAGNDFRAESTEAESACWWSVHTTGEQAWIELIATRGPDDARADCGNGGAFGGFRRSLRPSRRVFYEIDATNKIYTPAEGSVYAELLHLAGADPILTDESYEISLEELVAADPEIIVLGDAASGVTADQSPSVLAGAA